MGLSSPAQHMRAGRFPLCPGDRHDYSRASVSDASRWWWRWRPRGVGGQVVPGPRSDVTTLRFPSTHPGLPGISAWAGRSSLNRRKRISSGLKTKRRTRWPPAARASLGAGDGLCWSVSRSRGHRDRRRSRWGTRGRVCFAGTGVLGLPVGLEGLFFFLRPRFTAIYLSSFRACPAWRTGGPGGQRPLSRHTGRVFGDRGQPRG